MKIAMIGHKWIPSREGGIEVVVEELAVRMAQKGCSVVCYNRRNPAKNSRTREGRFSGKAEEAWYQGVRLKTVFTLNCKGLAAMTSSICATLLAVLGRYDILHFHAEGTCVLLWLPHLLGRKTVVTIHGLDHQRAKWGRFASAYIMLGERTAVKFADEIIVLSRNTQEYFLSRYGRRTTFIPNGVNRPEIRTADCITRKYGLQKDGYFLFLGRIVPEKGLRYLIEAFRKVDTDKKLVVAGGASDTKSFLEELKHMAAEDPRILFTGFVEGELLEELYSNAYVYVLPSDLEGMPLSLLEAMSFGNCCLVSDIDECAEVVEDHAVLFKRGDTADLARKLRALNRERETVGRYKAQAADFICGKYQWDKVTDRTLKLYEQCLSPADKR